MKMRHLLLAVVMLAVGCGSGERVTSASAPSAGLRYTRIVQLTLVSGPSATAVVEQRSEHWLGEELETFVPSEAEPCANPAQAFALVGS